MTRRRWRLVAISTTVMILLATILAFILPPQYSSEAVVLLDSRQQRVTNAEQVLSNLQVDSSSLRSEIDIITSRTMIDRVIDKLKLIEDPEFNSAARAVPWPMMPLHWLGLVASPQGEDRIRNEVARNIGAALDVRNEARSYSIRIRFRSQDPEKAARIANAFADAYLVDQLEAKFEAVQRANGWLSGRLDDLRGKVEAAEHAVEDFRQKANLTEAAQGTVLQQQLGQINTQMIQARAERSQAEARLRGAQSMTGARGSIEASGDVLASPLIQRLREQESEVQRKMADLESRYGERHPKIVNTRAELGDLRHKISEEAKKIIQGLHNEVEIAKAKENSLQSEMDKIEKTTGESMGQMVTLRQLQREADANRTLYESFLGRFKQTSEQQDLQMADARLIARAQPPVRPDFPSKPLFALLGLLVGMAVGLSLAWLVEYFDRGFRNAEQIESLLGLPAVGLVPSTRGSAGDQSPEDYVLDKPLSTFGESLRTVRTAVHFSNVDQPPKSVMITSAVPGEGKTTFSVSMGRVLAKSGNRVLLIDADMRRPKVSKLLASENGREAADLAQVLAGTRSVEQAIQVDTSSGLHFIAAHGETPNAQDLLGSHQMERLIRHMGEKYDLVIVDTPPILALADAAVVARWVDCTLLLVRWAETPRDMAAGAAHQLQSLGLHVAGVVLNQVDLAQHARYSYSDFGVAYGRYRDYYTN
ncbi:MAG: polysaccharide biosynthesis tyrosine autokinase [Alphaproteobacteria bacterium]|nr:MAG: polysaccharide biosynthesis tyrosine autokinase [Alphaproteobacteria bacterium]